jgi:hypothetical protein
MYIKNKTSTFPVLNIMSRVGWLDDSVIKNQGDDYLFPCGWTHCNMRASVQRRDTRHFPSIKFSDEQTPSLFARSVGKSGRLCKIMAALARITEVF